MFWCVGFVSLAVCFFSRVCLHVCVVVVCLSMFGSCCVLCCFSLFLIVVCCWCFCCFVC